ncbi:MAG TPA: SRPBCC family protein [Candidatus Eisenbacteria bacterium]|nr:SRPBCC family protein [Candidatus Eisenbacteria bacterium]
MDLGRLARDGDRWQLRFVRHLAHPAETVWQALTDPEHLRAWFPAEIEGERAVGATLRFVFPDGQGPTMPGEMIAYDPPALLEYRWGEDLLRFELRPEAAGCVLTFTTVFGEQGRAARDGAGWHTCLDLLAQHLAGAEPPWSPPQRWAQVHGAYVESLGPDAATVGPPPGSVP